MSFFYLSVIVLKQSSPTYLQKAWKYTHKTKKVQTLNDDSLPIVDVTVDDGYLTLLFYIMISSLLKTERHPRIPITTYIKNPRQ